MWYSDIILIVNIMLMLVNINLFSQLDMMPDLTNSPTLICIYKSNKMVYEM